MGLGTSAPAAVDARGQRAGRRGRTRRGGLLLGLLLFSAAPAGADELILVTGQRISGVVLSEAGRGVWIEVAPRVAAFFGYDKVVRADKWTAERNAALIDRSRPAPPVPNDILVKRRVLETPEGVWFEVEPRLALLVLQSKLRVLEARAAMSAAPAPPVRRGGTPATGRTETALRALYDEPEPLTGAQLSRRAGKPHTRERGEYGAVWIYALRDGATARVYFRDNQLDYVDIIAAPGRPPPATRNRAPRSPSQ